MLVDGDASARVGVDADPVELELVGVGLPAHGVEQGVAGHPFAALQLGPHQAVVLHPYADHVFPQPEDRVAAAHVVAERLDDLLVHEVQHGVP